MCACECVMYLYVHTPLCMEAGGQLQVLVLQHYSLVFLVTGSLIGLQFNM